MLPSIKAYYPPPIASKAPYQGLDANSSNWFDAQITRFDELLRENFSKNIDVFTQNTLTYICELTKASQGVFFIKAEKNEYLKAVVGYACPKKVLENTIFEVGEGLVGQVAASQKELHFDDLSDNSCYQEFATLKVKVANLLFLPLVFNGKVYGVLELAYLNPLETKYKDFLKEIGKNIAIMMESITSHTTTQGLLNITQIQKQLLNEREEELQQNLEEITAIHEILQMQNRQVEESFKKLEKSNASMLESIRYAKRIQEAILPSHEKLKNAFTDYFVIYKPKDIVSGDFYWYAEAKNKKFIGVIDCTGHGVPGAFMSMIANTLLNQIVIENKIHQPSLILDALHLKIKTTIQHGDSKSKDGMDLAICCIEPVSEKDEIQVSFAGAKCDLYYNDNKLVSKISGDRKTIGGDFISKESQPFTNHQIYLNKGDILYLTTDGTIDICNSERKRFGKKCFEELLNRILNMPFIKQKKMMEESIEVFQQDAEQRDDITLLTTRL